MANARKGKFSWTAFSEAFPRLDSLALWLIGLGLTNMDIAFAFQLSQAICAKESFTYQQAP